MYLKQLQYIPRTLMPNVKSLSYSAASKTYFLQHTESEKRSQWLKWQSSNFHTTQTLCISPDVAVVTCVSLQFCSCISASFLRRWWLHLTADQQQEYKRWFWKRKIQIFGSLGVFSSILIVYYLTHIENDPVLQQPRFIIFDKSERVAFGQFVLTMLRIKHQSNLLPMNDPRYSQLQKILQNMMNANKEVFANTHCTLSIVDAPSVNALVLPGGHIFVYSGVFDVAQSDDQIAFILAHELSHIFLLHTFELYSYVLLKEFVFSIPMFLIWFYFSKWKAVILCSAIKLLCWITLLNPYQRGLEIEADEQAFEIVAKSCIDIREVIQFWKIMEIFNNINGKEFFEMQFLKTHPSHKERAELLTRLLPKAMELRRQANCPKLALKDFRRNTLRVPLFMF